MGWIQSVGQWIKAPAVDRDITRDEFALRNISSGFWPFGIGALAIAFLGADAIGFMPSDLRLVLGLLILISIMFLFSGIAAKTNLARLILIGIPIFIITGGIWKIRPTIEAAANAAHAQNVRCQHIERAMLSNKPPRDDLPDIFEALQCHASTRYDINLEPSPPAEKEGVAEHQGIRSR